MRFYFFGGGVLRRREFEAPIWGPRARFVVHEHRRTSLSSLIVCTDSDYCHSRSPTGHEVDGCTGGFKFSCEFLAVPKHDNIFHLPERQVWTVGMNRVWWRTVSDVRITSSNRISRESPKSPQNEFTQQVIASNDPNDSNWSDPRSI